MTLSTRQPKFYRIIEQNLKPTVDRNSPQKVTQQIIRKNNYVYIDVNKQNGICQMQSINPEDADQDTEKINFNTYICSINRLPEQSQRTLQYVGKIQQLNKIKQKFKDLIKERLSISKQKRVKQTLKSKRKNQHQRRKSEISQIQSLPLFQHESFRKKSIPHKKNSEASINPQRINYQLNQINNLDPNIEKLSNKSVIVYRGMQTKHLKQFLEKNQLQQLNKKIISKEKLLIAKYGFTNQYQSVTKQKSAIVRKNRKVILPHLSSSFGLND